MRGLATLVACVSLAAFAQPAAYFPLGPADSWTYGTRASTTPPQVHPHPPIRVREEVSVHDTTYALLRVPNLFTDTLRTDEEGRVWGWIDDRDRLILDLTLADGATYSFVEPGAPACPSGADPSVLEACTYTVTVHRGLTVATVAGRFDHVVSFSFDIPHVLDEEIVFQLAPGVGVVYSSTWLQPVELIEATVGGQPITPVEDGPAASTARAFPNPFTSRLTVELPPGDWQHVEVVDILGRRVATLLDGPCTPVDCRVRWDGHELAPGAYLVRASGPTGSTVLPLVRSR